MNRPVSIPRISAVARLGLWPIPLAIIELALSQLARSIAHRHPAMFDRLGAHAGKRIVLEPTDLPFLIAMTLHPITPDVSIARSFRRQQNHARISGPVAALMGLAHGRYDGDALFFSGDLIVEGDVEATLAMRNALDDAEIDLLQEAAAILGPLSGLVEQLMRPAVPLMERITGLALTRGHSAAP